MYSQALAQIPFSIMILLDADFLNTPPYFKEDTLFNGDNTYTTTV